MRRRALAALLCVLLALVAAPALAAPPAEAPIVGVSGPTAPPPTAHLDAAGYRFERIQFATALWADGRGDVVLDLDLTNLGVADWRSLTWNFGWPSAAYSQIRAWDPQGPLPVTTGRSGSSIAVTPQFRAPVPIGERYSFSFAITIGGMASGGGSQWRAVWRTSSGSPVGEYVERLTLPSTAAVGAIAPLPTERRGSTLTWRTASAPPGWSFALDVAYTLRDRIPAPLFLQRDPPWGGRAYGSYPEGDLVNTVGYWGCFMTAGAIIARYHADQQDASPQINPEDLNRWLRDNKRYDGNYFNPVALPDYARVRGVTLAHQAAISGGRTDATDRVLDDYLRSGNPVILKVPAPRSPSKIHFVVAVGRVPQEGRHTYAVLDPYHGETTLAARYNNTYTTIYPFTGTPADTRALSFSGHSPVELLVTDPLGRRAGLDPRTGLRYAEIPGAVYAALAIAPLAGEGDLPADELKNLTIYAPLDGPYTVEVIGVGDGPFTLVTTGTDWLGRTTSHARSGLAALGSAQHFSAAYDSVGGLFPHTRFLPVTRR
ncbi:MAG: hypothetical protein HXY37_05555 [Chloroflexi bacterium]|nr:hypothetical protein [Chloroflexota bacterium]